MTLNQSAPVAKPAADQVLAVDNLFVELRLRTRTVYPLNGVSLTLARGETLGIVGESGSGKSMLSLAIMRLLPAPFGVIAGGSVTMAGRNLVTLSERDMRGLRGAAISMIFQEPMTALDPLFTVGSQVIEAIRAHLPVGRAEARDMAVDLLRRVGIPSPERRIDAYPFQLSGGMRQRVVIAIGLALRPRVLIADEPTTALDVTVQAQIMELLAQTQRELGMGTILITHDLGLVSEYADRIAVMYGGKLVEVAPAAELFARPAHPYTRGLIRAKAGGVDGAGRLHVIPGLPPVLTEAVHNCPFAARCERRLPRCEVEMPPTEVHPSDPGHSFACWNPVP